MISRFKKHPDGSMIRTVKINDTTYKLIVQNSIWEKHNVSRHVSHWIQQHKKGNDCAFKYGVVEVCNDITDVNICDKCNKQYKTRYGLLRHIKSKHPVTDIVPAEKAPPTAVSTTNNIENQTNNNTTINNIQQNIIIRPFGKENPKWITEKLIVDALRNIPGAIMGLVKEKHFNEKFPENRNVELCSEFRNRYVSVQEDNRRKVEDRKDMFMRMCNNACDAVTTTLESYTEPQDSDESEDEDETPEDRRCRLVANRIRQSDQFSAVVDTYIHKWQDYISTVEQDEVLKDADHYITMLLLDLKLALAHEAETMNIRGVSE